MGGEGPLDSVERGEAVPPPGLCAGWTGSEEVSREEPGRGGVGAQVVGDVL